MNVESNILNPKYIDTSKVDNAIACNKNKIECSVIDCRIEQSDGKQTIRNNEVVISQKIENSSLPSATKDIAGQQSLQRRYIYFFPIYVFFAIFLSIVSIDYITKTIALFRFINCDSCLLTVIPPFLHFTLVKNYGISFGIFNAHSSVQWLLIAINCLVLLGANWYFLSKIKTEFFKKSTISRHLIETVDNNAIYTSNSHWYIIGLALLDAGAIGNIIDRLQYGYVIDFIFFSYKNFKFPVFNIADSAIFIAVCLFYVLHYKFDNFAKSK